MNKAKIFYLENCQEKLAKDLQRSLRQIIYSNLDIDLICIEKDMDSGKVNRTKAEDYLQLLKAAIVKTKNFSLAVFVEHKGFWYMGNEADQKKSEFGDYHFGVDSNNLEHIFPAIAIMDRMVMLPIGITGVLESYPDDLQWLFKPLDNCGVELVDFENQAHVNNSINRVNKTLIVEISRYCNRYMHINKIFEPDNSDFFDKISTLLNIDLGFLNYHRNKLLLKLAELSVVWPTQKLKLKQKNQVHLQFKKETKEFSGTLYVEVKSPPNTLINSPVKEEFYFRENQELYEITFNAEPQAVPFLPLEILMYGGNEEIEMSYPHLFQVVLDVER